MRKTLLTIAVLASGGLALLLVSGGHGTPAYGGGPVGPRLSFHNSRVEPSGILGTELPGIEEIGVAADTELTLGGARNPLAQAPNSGPGAFTSFSGTSGSSNVVFNLDNSFLPQNEPTIAINPTNSNNIVAGANDYRRRFTPTAGAIFVVGSGAYFSTDGGKTVQEGVRPAVEGGTGPVRGILFPIDFNIPKGQGGPRAYQGSGDPSIDFDGEGNVRGLCTSRGTCGRVWRRGAPW